MGEEKAKKLGMDRREFMASSMGLATCFLASNMVYGNNWDVDEAETLEPGAYEDKYPKSEYFIIDVQAHFTNGLAIGFRNQEFVKNMGFKLDELARGLRLPELRQGDVLRQRNGDAGHLRRARQGERKSTARATRSKGPSAAAACCRAG